MTSPLPLENLSDEELRSFLAEKSREYNVARSRNAIDELFPPTGPLRRELYQKHMEFFRAGACERERAFMAANRVGKSTSGGGYETATHLTGVYPDWWEGRRFDHPIRAWAAGDTGETVREIIQPILFGEPGAYGTGLIRGDTIEKTTSKRGSPDAIESARIRHTSGGTSTLLLKSYEQGRKSFQGTKMDLIWLDEEPSMAIYAECLLRTAATTPEGDDWGSLLCTFTPLLGISDVVLKFLGEGLGVSSAEGTTKGTAAAATHERNSGADVPPANPSHASLAPELSEAPRRDLLGPGSTERLKRQEDRPLGR